MYKRQDYDEITLDELKEVPLVLRERGSGTLDVSVSYTHLDVYKRQS